MARIRFADEKTDKGVQQVTQTRRKETKTRVTTGEVKSNDIKPGQFVFTTIKKGQIGPSEPTSFPVTIRGAAANNPLVYASILNSLSFQ